MFFSDWHVKTVTVLFVPEKIPAADSLPSTRRSHRRCGHSCAGGHGSVLQIWPVIRHVVQSCGYCSVFGNHLRRNQFFLEALVLAILARTCGGCRLRALESQRTHFISMSGISLNFQANFCSPYRSVQHFDRFRHPRCARPITCFLISKTGSSNSRHGPLRPFSSSSKR